MDKLKINLYGDTFAHNIVNGKISSTLNKSPKYIEFVTDLTGSISLLVDQTILNVEKIKTQTPIYGWLLESKSIHPNLIQYFKTDTEKKIEKFEYVFTHNRELLDLNKKFKFLHPIGYWIDENLGISKSKLISMITSNKSHTENAKIRLNFAKKNLNKIDIFGKGFHPVYKKEIALLPYCFSIVVENDSTPDYFSEKLLDCFASKTIPIYLGSQRIKNYFDEKGILNFNQFKHEDISFQYYDSLSKHIENNYNEVKKYRIPEDTMFEKYLDI